MLRYVCLKVFPDYLAMWYTNYFVRSLVFERKLFCVAASNTCRSWCSTVRHFLISKRFSVFIIQFTGMCIFLPRTHVGLSIV